jgi:hypothetical protein
MKAQCKTCGRNCEGEYCFQHKPRKKMPTSRLKVTLPEKHPITQINPMKEMFLRIWKTRPRKSEVSGEYLIGSVSTAFFHHILPKSKYPEAALDEENIILLTLLEHEQVEMDIYRYEEVNKRREKLLKKYERTK